MITTASPKIKSYFAGDASVFITTLTQIMIDNATLTFLPANILPHRPLIVIDLRTSMSAAE